MLFLQKGRIFFNERLKFFFWPEMLKRIGNTAKKQLICNHFPLDQLNHKKLLVKGSDQRENRGVWSNINTRYLVWRCGDGHSCAL
jgi:hypothetical protein